MLGGKEEYGAKFPPGEVKAPVIAPRGHHLLDDNPLHRSHRGTFRSEKNLLPENILSSQKDRARTPLASIYKHRRSTKELPIRSVFLDLILA